MVASVVSRRGLNCVQRVYLKACRHVAAHHPSQPVSWWGFCSLLSRYHLQRGETRTEPELWSELFPFLLMRDHATAELAVEEYLVYLEDARSADVEWLGIEINRALERANAWDESIAGLLRQPTLVLAAPWLALLAYQSLLRLRRAVAVYDSDLARALRPKYWHGTPSFPEQRADGRANGRRTVQDLSPVQP